LQTQHLAQLVSHLLGMLPVAFTTAVLEQLHFQQVDLLNHQYAQ
jgi:hypothetical protein